jgi:predicted ArsR family transcriptional regulator
LLEETGRRCAQCGEAIAVEKVLARVGPEAGEFERVDALIADLNGALKGAGTLTRDGRTVTLVFGKCFCPMAKSGIVSPILCDCSMGWEKEIWSRVAGHPVDVELRQTVHRGAETCVTIVRL